MLTRHVKPFRLAQIRPAARTVTSSKCPFSSSSHENLIYPEPPTTQHNSLSSFISYAERSGLEQKSTVFVGTHYEYTVALSLSRYGFALKRIGGQSDYGTDLLGVWTPPSTSQTMKVLVQCKAGTSRVGPNYIRELEGAFVGAPSGWRGSGVLGLLVSQRPATKGVRDGMGRSKLPMGYVCCEGDGAVKQMVWNRRAEEEGLERFGVTTRHGERGDMELVLIKDGKILPLLEETE